MKLEHKTFPMQVKEVTDAGEISGYLSVFNNVDAYRDIVLPGAFKESLEEWRKKGRLPPMLWQHQGDQPVGPFTKLEEDTNGLYFEGRLLIADVQRSREAYALVKNDVVAGMSIGFVTQVDEWDEDERVRKLHKIKLWEGSIVTFAANEEAQIQAVKAIMDHGQLPELKTFERLLREAGFSKSQAKAVANHGLPYLLRCEAEGPGDKEMSQLLGHLKSLSIT